MKANLGKGLETLIELSNVQYTRKKEFIGLKVPTPIKVVRRGKKIISAFFEEKSTVDFIGIYKKVPVAFDCKETRSKTSFPLKNIKEHQKTFLKSWKDQGGKAFFIIDFIKVDKIFILTLDQLFQFEKEHDRKSIPISFFLTNCKTVKSEKGLHLNYLEYVL